MLQKRGATVRVIAENEAPHPIRYLTDLKHPLSPWLETGPEEFSHACLGKFSRFLAQATAGTKPDLILIVDGLLFHTDSTSLLLMDPEEDVFAGHIREMQRIGQRVRFLSILLYNQPHAAALKSTMAQRSKEWRTMQVTWKTSSPYCIARKQRNAPGYVEFYEHYEKLICAIFSSLPHTDDHHLILANPADNWKASREKIWSFCVKSGVASRFFNELL